MESALARGIALKAVGVARDLRMTEEDKENGAAATGEVSKMDTTGPGASAGGAQ